MTCDIDAVSVMPAALEARLRRPRARDLARLLPSLLGVLLLALALWALHRELGEHSYRDVAAGLGAIPPARVLTALGLSGLCYVVLTGYDALAFAYLRHRLPYPGIARASFAAYALGNNLGFTLLTSSSVRLRFYSAMGVPAGRIAGVIAFCALTSWVRFAAVAGGMLLALPAILRAARLPEALAGPLEAQEAALRTLGVAALAFVVAYLTWSARGAALTIRGRRIPLPRLEIAAGQVGLSLVATALPAGVLYVLLDPRGSLSFPAFLGIFLVAQFTGLLSHVPAGLGVFESALVLLLPSAVPAPAALAALLVYRTLFFLLPLGAAALVMGAHELLRPGRRSPAAFTAETPG